MSTPQKRRTNDEILQAIIAERKLPTKRKRRTKSQIARDKRLAEKAKLEKQRAAETKFYVVTVVNPEHLLGAMRKPGEEITVRRGTHEYDLAYDINGNFVLNKTPAEQAADWGKVVYTVREEHS